MQGELAALAVWGVVLQIWTEDSFTAKSCFNQPSCRLRRHPPLHREGKFVVCSVWYFIAENRIKQFAQSISQSADADSSLYQREPCCSLGLKCWFAVKQVYQIEPCCSLGLMCWFATEQVQQREPVLRFVWFIDLQGKIVQSTLLSALPTPSLAQGGQVCSLFSLVFYSEK